MCGGFLSFQHLCQCLYFPFGKVWVGCVPIKLFVAVKGKAAYAVDAIHGALDVYYSLRGVEYLRMVYQRFDGGKIPGKDGLST